MISRLIFFLFVALFSGNISAQPPPENLPQSLFEFSERYNPDYAPSGKDEFYDWAESLRARLPERPDASRLIRLWEQFLYSEKNVEYRANSNALFLDEVIQTQTGNRLAVSGLWVALAQDLQVPFQMVLAPRHPFIVYNAKGVKKYIEVGVPRRTYPLNYFKKEKLSSAYFRPLNSKEIMALYHHALAEKLSEDGDLDSAEKLIRQAVKDFPGVAEFSSDLGQIYLKKGSVKKAERGFRRAIKIYPKDLPALKGLAGIRWQKGDLTQAQEYLERILEINSEDLKALRSVSLIQMLRLGLFEAEGYVSSILALKPEDPEALAYHATIQFFHGHEAKAQENFDKALKKGLDDPRTLTALGLRYLLWAIGVDTGFLRQAMEYFRKAEALAPDDWLIQYLIGLVYVHSQEYERAKEVFTQILERAPASSDALLGLANSCIETGEFDQAQSAIERAANIDPELPSYYFTQALFHFRRGDLKTAAEKMKLAVKKAPFIRKNYWRLFLAEIYVEDKLLDEAMTVLEGILADQPRYIKAYELQGRILLEKGELDAAEKKLTIALNYMPQNGETLKLLAKVAFEKKDYSAAWRYIRGAQREGVQDPEFMAKLREKAKE